MDELTRELNLAKLGLIKSYLAKYQMILLGNNSSLAQFMGASYAFTGDAIIFAKADVEKDLIWLEDNVYLYKYRLSFLLETLTTLEKLKNPRGLSYKELLFEFATPLETTID